MSSRIIASGLVAIAAALVVASPVAAQYRRPGMPMQPQMQKTKTGGTVISANQSGIQLTTNSNQTMSVMVGPQTEVSITGTAEPDYLRPGLCVEFVAEVAKGGAVKEKIDHLTVITPSTDRAVGLYPPDAAEKKPAKDDKGKKGKGAGPADPGVDNPAPAKGQKARGKKDDPLGGDLLNDKPSKSQGPAKPPGTFTVRGTIKMAKNGALSVLAGRTTVKGELSDDATIDVDVSDLRTAQRDDKVTVDGMTSQMRPNMVMAKSVTIELAKPLTGKKHNNTHATKPPAGHDKAKKDAAAADDAFGGK